MATAKVAPADGKAPPKKGPLLGTIWFVLTFIAFGATSAAANYNTLILVIGWRSMIALAGYLVMQVGLWHAEFKWDEEGSAAYLEAAGKDKGSAPEELDAVDMGSVTIPVSPACCPTTCSTPRFAAHSLPSSCSVPQRAPPYSPHCMPGPWQTRIADQILHRL